jgi:PleD family two-component response regulator
MMFILVACDKPLVSTLLPLTNGIAEADFVATWETASEALKEKRFDLVMVDIFFDDGLRLFDLLRGVRASDNRDARLICFRSAPPAAVRSEAVCDDAIAYAAKAIASAEYWDLSDELKRSVARNDLISSMDRTVSN